MSNVELALTITAIVIIVAFIGDYIARKDLW